MSVNFLLYQKTYVRHVYITKDNLGKVYSGNRNDSPKDMSKSLVDRRPSQWGASPRDFCRMRLKFLILAKERLLVCVERDDRLSRSKATEEETGEAFNEDDENERDDILN